jgi:hypothetical protein
MPSLTLQPAFTGGELSPSLTARVDMANYATGCRTLRNFKVQPHGGAVKRPGFLLLDALPGPAALLKFSFNVEQSYCLALGEKWMRVFIAEGPVLDDKGAPYQVKTPYTLTQARSLSSVQSGDTLFLAVQGVAPTKLIRYDHADWRFAAMSFAAPLAAPRKPTVSFVPGAKKSDGSASPAQLVTPYTYYITAVDADGKESELSPGADIDGPSANNWQSGDYIALAWNAVSGAKEYRVYRASYGGLPGYVTTAGGTSCNDCNTEASFSEGVPKYENPFPDKDYPGLVALYEQRLLLASTPKRPQTIWLSKSGDYGNFAKYKPLVDDSPIELTVASEEVSAFSWACVQNGLILGAEGAEWEIKASQGAFTAKTAQASRRGGTGSAAGLPALVLGNSVLHVGRSCGQVFGLKYDFGSDSYADSDATIMASQLLERFKASEWTYQQFPDSIIWIVREDGVLLGLTYQTEHKVFAWHRHDTLGAFRAVCAIPGRVDHLFAEVERDGAFYLEIMTPEYVGGDYGRAVFLDCALVYDRPGQPVSRLSGLDHLEGKTVGILAGGAVHPPRTVQDGGILLERPAELVIVGLEYSADLETMPVEVVSQQGTSVGRKKQINEVNVLFRNSVGAKSGVSFDHLETVKWRSDEPHGTAPRPFSGLRSVVVPNLAESQVTVCLRSDEPTPLTVLAIMAKLDVK